MKKCLLCRQTFDDIGHFKSYYRKEHSFSTSNIFFQKLFEISGRVGTTGSSVKPKNALDVIN